METQVRVSALRRHTMVTTPCSVSAPRQDLPGRAAEDRDDLDIGAERGRGAGHVQRLAAGAANHLDRPVDPRRARAESTT